MKNWSTLTSNELRDARTSPWNQCNTQQRRRNREKVNTQRS